MDTCSISMSSFPPFTFPHKMSANMHYLKKKKSITRKETLKKPISNGKM